MGHAKETSDVCIEPIEERILVYHEPSEHGDVTTRLTFKEAIERQRKACIQARGKDIYPNNREALLDFISIHWAYEAKQTEDHEGMMYNEYTKKWSWF